jgi:hypothetical protein
MLDYCTTRDRKRLDRAVGLWLANLDSMLPDTKTRLRVLFKMAVRDSFFLATFWCRGASSQFRSPPCVAKLGCYYKPPSIGVTGEEG